MLVSYSWSQDALRLGTFVKGKGSLAEQRLVDLILRDLSKVHDIAYEDLKSWQVDHHAYNWYDNEFTVGKSFSTALPYERIAETFAQGLSHSSDLLSSVKCTKKSLSQLV